MIAIDPSISQLARAAYGRVGGAAASEASQGVNVANAGSSGGFGATLQDALQGALATGHQADQQAVAALNGEASLTDVVTAVSRAQLALQTTTVIRDRVVQAYQDIMRMSI